MSRRIAVYVRVSSSGQSMASQEPDLRRWAEAQPPEADPVGWYRDTFTGKTMDRPGWNRLQADLDSGKLSAVVCWRLDRLGRTAKGLTSLFHDLVERKVNLVSLREGIDLATPAGRMMANVIASMAQYETEIRAERTIAGQAAARERGQHLGRKPGIRTRLKVTPEQEAVVKRLKAEGQGVTAIARATGLSRPTVYSVLGTEGVAS